MSVLLSTKIESLCYYIIIKPQGDYFIIVFHINRIIGEIYKDIVKLLNIA